MIVNPICIMCGSPKGKMPIRFMDKLAYMCPKCYYAGVPALAPRFNPKTTHHVSFCTRFQKPFLTPKISAERGTVKCPYCGQWHRIRSEASPNPKYPKWEPQICKFCGAKTHTQYELRVCRKEQATGKVIPLRVTKNPILHTTKGWFWGSRGPFSTREKAVEVARAAYAAGYRGNPKISRPRGIEDGLIKAETEEQIKKLVLKFKATPPLERTKLLRDLILRVRTHDDVDLIRQAVRRANLLLELQEVQKEIETERARRRLGYKSRY